MITTDHLLKILTLCEGPGSGGFLSCLRQRRTRQFIWALLPLTLHERNVINSPDSKRSSNETREQKQNKPGHRSFQQTFYSPHALRTTWKASGLYFTWIYPFSLSQKTSIKPIDNFNTNYTVLISASAWKISTLRSYVSLNFDNQWHQNGAWR